MNKSPELQTADDALTAAYEERAAADRAAQQRRELVVENALNNDADYQQLMATWRNADNTVHEALRARGDVIRQERALGGSQE